MVVLLCIRPALEWYINNLVGCYINRHNTERLNCAVKVITEVILQSLQNSAMACKYIALDEPYSSVFLAVAPFAKVVMDKQSPG